MRIILAAALAALTISTADSAAIAQPAANSADQSRWSREQVERYIRQRSEEWSAVAVTHDPSPVATILADDYSGVSSRNTVVTKVDAMAPIQGTSPYSTTRVDYINYRHYPNLVIAQGAETLTRRDGAAPVRLIWTDLWMLRNGLWQVVTSQDARLPAPDAAPVPAAAPAAVADHVAIQVSDVDKAAAFYRGVFGFAEIAAAVPGTRWFDLGAGTALHIIGGRRGAVGSRSQAGRPSHLAIRTAALDPVLAALRSRGATWRDWDGTQGAITTREDGVRQIFLQDPDGHWLEVNDAARTR